MDWLSRSLSLFVLMHNSNGTGIDEAQPLSIRNLVLALPAVSLCSLYAQKIMTLDIGDYAPEFTLPNADGESIDLKRFRGQWVVLYFYPRDNTPGCTKEACGFRDQYETYQTEQVVILGVSGDDAKSHQKFINKQNLPFQLLSDLDFNVAKSYEAYGPKKFMGKEYEGIYRHSFLIDPDGKLAKIYRKVKAADHATDVLQDLELLRK